MKQLRLFEILVICLCALFVILPEIGFAQTEELPRVLVLNSYHPGFEWTETIVSGIRSEFEKTEPDIELTLEYMDTKKYDPTEIFPYLKELYQLKYQKVRFDVIITTDNDALDFLLMNRNQLFPGVPVVFTAFNNLNDSLIAGHTGITGVVEDFDIKGTLDLALHLHPGTENVAVISDITSTDAANRERLEQIKPEFEERLNFIDLAGLSVADLQIALTQLPKNTVILLFNLYRLAQGDVFTLEEGITLISESSNLPIYSMWESRVKSGILGGIVISGEMQGQYAAKMAIRIMNGETPADIPILRESPNIPMFNYAQLQRFGLALSSLPEGSIVFNKPDTFYSRYKNYILGVLIFGSVLILIIIALLISITRRRQAEKALQEAHDQLEDRVVQRTKELEKANLKLQELDRLKSMFIASMSHELRTPLNSIIGFTGIILQGMSGEINQEQRKQLSLVKNSANHLLDLINDIIDISKIEADKIELYIQEFDLSLLAQGIKESFAVAAKEKGLKLFLQTPPTLLMKSDERRTKQILVNFISNALKFTDQGEIEVKIVKKDETAVISVRDVGIGMEKEDMGKLFQSFSRIATSGRLTEGTGLGLYLSKKIAHLLGGDITAESEFGKGSVFTLTLPLKYKEAKV